MIWDKDLVMKFSFYFMFLFLTGLLYNWHIIQVTHFKYTIQRFFNKFTELYNQYQNLVLEHFLSLQKDPFYHPAVDPHPYCPS